MSLVPLPTYSFADVYGMIVGPGLSTPIGMNVGSADEGISWEMREDAGRLTIGAGGDGMHSLVKDVSGRCAIHLLKTSPLNAIFELALKYQRTTSALWGLNTITMANVVTGESYTGTRAAFVKRPNNSYSKDPNMLTWEFNCVSVSAILGTGL